MKKLENFSWKMWQVYTLSAVTIFMIGSIWSFFFLKEASYVRSERNYRYVGQDQRMKFGKVMAMSSVATI